MSIVRDNTSHHIDKYRLRRNSYSQINAKVNDGVLEIKVLKKNPTKPEGSEEFKANVS